MAQILIREAVDSGDIEQVRRLMVAYGEYLASNPRGAANICLQGYANELERLPEPYQVLLLATVDGVAGGCVALKKIQSPTAESQACELKRLWVGSEFRGLGLGRRLVEEALQWAERKGFDAMYLDTVPLAMPEANRLYEAMGFQRVERYNSNPIENVVFFRRNLGKSSQVHKGFDE